MKFESIKLDARAALIGNRSRQLWLLCIISGLLLLFSAANLVFNVAALLSGFHSAGLQVAFACSSLLIALLLISPFRLKAQKSLNENAGIFCASKSSFTPRNAAASASLYTLLFLLKAAWLVFYLILPALFAAGLYARLSGSPMNAKAAVTLFAGLAALTATGIGFWLVTVQRYSRAAFCLAASPGISAAQAISRSALSSKGAYLETLAFKLSFLPWFLLCAAVLPIGYVWAYYKQSLTCYFMQR